MKSNTSSVNQGYRLRTAAQRNIDATKSPDKRAETVDRKELFDLRADLDNLISECKNKNLSDSDLNRKTNDFIGKISSMGGERKNTFAHSRALLDNGLNRAKDYMQNYPGRAVGYSALIGVLMGLMINRPGSSKSIGSAAAHALRSSGRPDGGRNALIMRHLEQAFRASDPETCKTDGGPWCWCAEGVDGEGKSHPEGFCCNTNKETCICEDE